MIRFYLHFSCWRNWDLIGNIRALDSNIASSCYHLPHRTYAVTFIVMSLRLTELEQDFPVTVVAFNNIPLQHGCLILMELSFLLGWFDCLLTQSFFWSCQNNLFGILSMFNVLVKFSISHVCSIEINCWNKDFVGSAGDI